MSMPKKFKSFEEFQRALVEATKEFGPPPPHDKITIIRRVNDDVPKFLEDYEKFKEEARNSKIIVKNKVA